MEIERFQRNAALLHSTVGGDVVALDVDRGRCFGMEEVGARIWDLLAAAGHGRGDLRHADRGI